MVLAQFRHRAFSIAQFGPLLHGVSTDLSAASINAIQFLRNYLLGQWTCCSEVIRLDREWSGEREFGRGGWLIAGAFPIRLLERSRALFMGIEWLVCPSWFALGWSIVTQDKSRSDTLQAE